MQFTPRPSLRLTRSRRRRPGFDPPLTALSPSLRALCLCNTNVPFLRRLRKFSAAIPVTFRAFALSRFRDSFRCRCPYLRPSRNPRLFALPFRVIRVFRGLICLWFRLCRSVFHPCRYSGGNTRIRGFCFPPFRVLRVFRSSFWSWLRPLAALSPSCFSFRGLRASACAPTSSPLYFFSARLSPPEWTTLVHSPGCPEKNSSRSKPPPHLDLRSPGAIPSRQSAHNFLAALELPRANMYLCTFMPLATRKVHHDQLARKLSPHAPAP